MVIPGEERSSKESSESASHVESYNHQGKSIVHKALPSIELQRLSRSSPSLKSTEVTLWYPGRPSLKGQARVGSIYTHLKLENT
mgnify:CR=1 FL=1